MLAVTVRFHVAPAHAEAFFERVRQQAKDSLEREAACTQFDVCRNVRESDSRYFSTRFTMTNRPLPRT